MTDQNKTHKITYTLRKLTEEEKQWKLGEHNSDLIGMGEDPESEDEFYKKGDFNDFLRKNKFKEKRFSEGNPELTFIEKVYLISDENELKDLVYSDVSKIERYGYEVIKPHWGMHKSLEELNEDLESYHIKTNKRLIVLLIIIIAIILFFFM